MKSSLAPDRRSPDKSQQESKGPVDQGQAVEMQSVNQIRPSIATEFLCCYHHSCVPSTKFYRIFVFFKHLLIYLSLHLYLSIYLSIYLSHSTFICMILFFFLFLLLHKRALNYQLCGARGEDRRKKRKSLQYDQL
jgi:hypothetical protein